MLAVGFVTVVLAITEAGVFQSIIGHDSAASESHAEITESTERPKWTAPAPTKPYDYIKESVIYDGNDIKITVKGQTDNPINDGVSILVENNTDNNIRLRASDFIVNGIVLEDYINVEVASHKKAYATIEFDSTELFIAGIYEIHTIVAADAYIYNTDARKTMFDIDFRIDTTSAGSDPCEIDRSGMLLYEGNDVTVIAKNIEPVLLGYYVYVVIINNRLDTVTADVEDLSVNGFTITSIESEDIYPQTARLCHIYISDMELEDIGANKIEEVTFTLEFRKGFMQTIFKTEELTIPVN